MKPRHPSAFELALRATRRFFSSYRWPKIGNTHASFWRYP